MTAKRLNLIILATLFSFARCTANDAIYFSVVPRLIYSAQQTAYGSGTFVLSGSNLSYQISVPVGGWDVWLRGPSIASQMGTCNYVPPLEPPGLILVTDLTFDPPPDPIFFEFPPPYPIDPPNFPVTEPLITAPLVLQPAQLVCAFEGTLTISEGQICEILAGLWTLEGNSRLQGGMTIFMGPILPLDSDHDGVPDYLDQCAYTPTAAIVNTDGCSIDQLCPRDGPWRNHGDYLKQLRAVTSSFVDAGIITEDAAQGILRDAARWKP